MKIRNLIFLSFPAAICFALSSCNPTKKLTEGEYLLDKNAVIDKYGSLDKTEMETYIKQKPNRKLLFWRMYLHIYNSIDQGKLDRIKAKRIAKREAYNARKTEKFNRINAKREAKGKKKLEYSLKDKKPFIFREWWLSVGEPPVIYDSLLAKKSAKQIKLYANNKGYFNSVVKDSVSQPVHKKVKSYYIIHEGKPYTVRNLSYEIKDEQLNYFVLSNASSSLITRGINYDVDVLQRERDRITNDLRNDGYFYFSKEYIYFEIDSSLGTHEVDITLGIKNPVKKVEGERSATGGDSLIETGHNRYYIGNIFLYTDYDPKIKTAPRDTMLVSDSTVDILYTGKLKYKPKLLSSALFISKGALYQQTQADLSYRRLSELHLFRTVQLAFVPGSGDKLDCHVYLSNIPKQSFSAETELINTSGTQGIAGSLVFQNKNTFKGGEIFEVKLKGALEVQKTRSQDANSVLSSESPFNTLELGSEINLRIPRFLTPFRNTGTKSNNAKTNFTATYNFQKRPDYIRSIGSASYGYTWKETATKQHTINPIEYNLVSIDITSDSLRNTINASKDLFLRNSYSDHFTLGTRYIYTYNNQEIAKQKSFSYFRFSAEGAGNAMRGVFLYLDEHVKPLDYISDINYDENGLPVDTEKNYTIEHIRFSQYVRTDFDFRYYKLLNDKDKVVYRVAFGLGKPFFNLRVLPLEKSFFAGGPNSVRAWQTRTLGPGSYSDNTSAQAADKIGDVKFEANYEYRFNIIKILNGALFVDAGNIWLRKPYSSYPGGEITSKGKIIPLKTIVGEVALGTGMGFRLDFNFFIIRLDAAFRLKDPALPEGDRWMLGKKPLNTTVLNFGIGYPF